MGRTGSTLLLAASLGVVAAGLARAEAPVASYLFPPGAQRGTTATVRVGGLNLHDRPSFELLGPGLHAAGALRPTKTVWFEGPVIPLPDSQQAEDYPKDYAVTLRVDADTPVGGRYLRVWTAQGATSALPFVVGELPEVVEDEIDGDPVPVRVSLPVTVNGRIFPREDVDIWSCDARRGDIVTCAVDAARLGSPLDARIEVRDAAGRRLAESDDECGVDPRLHFAAPADGTYQVRIHDINVRGAQSYVYRLTITTSPRVDMPYPLGGRRGSTTHFQLLGAGVPTAPVAIDLPADGPAEHWERWGDRERTSNPFVIALDDLPEVCEAEPNDAPSQALAVALPAVVNGRVDRPGDADTWAVALKRGEPVHLALAADALGSPLDAVVVIQDADGKELVRAQGTANGPRDPSLRFSAPADGVYVVRVADRFRSRGGPRHAYRLRIDRAGPGDFRLRLPGDALTLEPNGQAKLKVEAERVGGFGGAIALTVEGLPPGVSAAATTIGATQGAAQITLKAARDAPARSAHLKVIGTAQAGGATIVRTAAVPARREFPALESVLLVVAFPTPFTIKAETDFRWAPRGTVHHRHYAIERGGYQGPIEIRLADRQARHLQGVTGPTLTIAPGVSTFDYPIQLPPWMETGRTSRSVVMAIATVADRDGVEHEVSYSSPKPEAQIIAVVEPGRLSVEAGLASIRATPGGTASVPVRLTRAKALRGTARLELVVPCHLSALRARPVELEADERDGSLQITCDAALPDAINAPLVIRATVMEHGDPVVAETKLAAVPGSPPGR